MHPVDPGRVWGGCTCPQGAPPHPRFLILPSTSQRCLDEPGLVPGISTVNPHNCPMRLGSLSSFYRRGKRLRIVKLSLQGHIAGKCQVRIWTLVSANFVLGSFSLGSDSGDNRGDTSHTFSPGMLSTALGGKKGKCSSPHSPAGTGAPGGLCPSLVWGLPPVLGSDSLPLMAM